MTNNYKFTDSDEKQRVGRFWGGNTPWEAKYVCGVVLYIKCDSLTLLQFYEVPFIFVNALVA